MSDFDKSTEAERLTLQQLAARADQWDAEFSETNAVSAEQIAVEDTSLIVDKNRFALDQSGRNRLFSRAGAPVRYLSERSISVQMVALQEHLQQGDFGHRPKLILRGDQVFTIATGELIELGHSEVLRAVTESLGDDSRSLSVSRIDRSDGRLEMGALEPG